MDTNSFYVTGGMAVWDEQLWKEFEASLSSSRRRHAEGDAITVCHCTNSVLVLAGGNNGSLCELTPPAY